MGTGYTLTFEEFHRLVSEAYSRPVVASLLNDWFGYEIEGQGVRTVVRTPEGSTVDLQVLHAKIQWDKAKQQSIYRSAMTLWR
jgi:hypothetical protein